MTNKKTNSSNEKMIPTFCSLCGPSMACGLNCYVKDGKLVFEEYFYGYDREKSHFLASVSKSITSILVGIAIEQHPKANEKTMAYEFFPSYTHTKWVDQKYPITLQHALTMSAGLGR